MRTLACFLTVLAWGLQTTRPVHGSALHCSLQYFWASPALSQGNEGHSHLPGPEAGSFSSQSFRLDCTRAAASGHATDLHRPKVPPTAWSLNPNSWAPKRTSSCSLFGAWSLCFRFMQISFLEGSAVHSLYFMRFYVSILGLPVTLSHTPLRVEGLLCTVNDPCPSGALEARAWPLGKAVRMENGPPDLRRLWCGQ